MSEKKISYLSRNYNDYKNSLLTITQQYYSNIFPYFNDASIGMWFIDLFAEIADNLSYHIDRTYQETSLSAANDRASLLDIANTMGVKIPSKRPSLVEVEISCELPLASQKGSNNYGDLSSADESYAPRLERGTIVSDGLHTFELIDYCDFKEVFGDYGDSDRMVQALRDSNGNINRYRYTKLAVAIAGQSKIYKKIVTSSDIYPFMEIVLNDSDIIGIESIIVKDGTNLSSEPNINDFYVDKEKYTDSVGRDVTRFFEVDSLIEQYRFGHEIQETVINGEKVYNPIWENVTYPEYQIEDVDGTLKPLTIQRIARGKWERLKYKFITEPIASGGLKIIFGSGIENQYGEIPTDASEFTQYMMSRMEANDYMGVLPKPNSTIYILYRVGGGIQSNIAKDTLKHFLNLKVDVMGNCQDPLDVKKKRDVLQSIKITNTTPSYGGKDEPSDEEIKYLIKYHTSSQNRCVTLRDYESKIMEIPHKYGTPFRCKACEENNKIKIYALGIDPKGKLYSPLSEYVANNIKEYLSNYKMLNDFVEIHSGNILNISFEIDIYVDDSYDTSEVVKRVIETVQNYMDIRKHTMGEDVFLGDVEKEISKLDGVANLIELRCYDKAGEEGYSNNAVTQPYVTSNSCETQNSYIFVDSNTKQIDIKNNDKILMCDAYSMFEIKNKNDIIVNVKTRQR